MSEKIELLINGTAIKCTGIKIDTGVRVQEPEGVDLYPTFEAVSQPKKITFEVSAFEFGPNTWRSRMWRRVRTLGDRLFGWTP